MSIIDQKFNDFILSFRDSAKSSSDSKLYDKLFNYGLNSNESPIFGVKFNQMVKYVYYISILCTGLALFSMLIGILSLITQGFNSVVYFSVICIFLIPIGPLAHFSLNEGNQNRLLFVALIYANLVWIQIALVYTFTYIFIESDESFNVAHHHIFIFIYLSVTILLEVILVMLAFHLFIYFSKLVFELEGVKK